MASSPKKVRIRRLSLYELSMKERPENKEPYSQEYMDKVLAEISKRIEIAEEHLSILKSIENSEPPTLDVKDLNPKHKEFLAKLPHPSDFLHQVKDFVDYMVVEREYNKIEERDRLDRIENLKMDKKTLLETD